MFKLVKVSFEKIFKNLNNYYERFRNISKNC